MAQAAQPKAWTPEVTDWIEKTAMLQAAAIGIVGETEPPDPATMGMMRSVQMAASSLLTALSLLQMRGPT